jgi:hypothetical protein
MRDKGYEFRVEGQGLRVKTSGLVAQVFGFRV